MVVEAKICGLTRPEDAAWAAGQGAARLGVVFAWGPRVITAGRARDIVAAADGVPVIGVVGAGSVAEWLRLAEEARLSGLQLHGGSTPTVEKVEIKSRGHVRRSQLSGWGSQEDSPPTPSPRRFGSSEPTW